MSGRTPGRRRLAALVAMLAVVAGTQFVLTPNAVAVAVAAGEQGFVPISGAGSTWSFNALDQWRRNVDALFGIQVQFAPTGSSDGRNQFREGTVEFAVSELEYGLTDGGVTDPPPTRAFGYLPVVAGGTAFMYNLKIDDKRVTNLRLSGETLAKIFTKRITSWDDPAIKADNPGLTLPTRGIVPVVRSDGASTTAQFTRYLADQYPAIWDDYCHRAGRQATPCGFTSYYPLTDTMVAKPGSQGVAGFVAQDSSEGAITYVEYSYARNVGFPVVKMLNAANYYVAPTAANVAVGLLNARINPDLTADLRPVYVDTDPRTYPLSNYSYMIIPKDDSLRFTAEKGRTLSEFAYYFLCEGQQQADALGYSPLPINLVQAGLDQVGQIPGSTNKLDRNDLQQCNNPTFSPDGTNLLARDAPQPDPCDRKGTPPPCTSGGVGATTTTLIVSPQHSIPSGIPVVLHATVAPAAAAGTVRFKDGTTTLGTPVRVFGGHAVAVISTLTQGTHSLTAEFIPTSPTAFGPSSSPPASLTVTPALWQTISARIQNLLKAISDGLHL